jgi:hypothetical protein
LQGTVSWQLEEVNNGISQISAVSDGPDYLHPLELSIFGEYSDSDLLYHYRLTLMKYKAVIYDEKIACKEPWEFLTGMQWTELDSHDINVMRTLERSRDSFHLIIKNGEITFQDVFGKGFFRIYPDVTDHFWVQSVEQALEVEVVSIFQDIVHQQPRTDAEVKSKLTVALMNRFMVLQKAIETTKDRVDLKEALEVVDWQHVVLIIGELKVMYDSLLEPVMHSADIHLSQLKDAKELIDMRMFKMLLLNLLSIIVGKVSGETTLQKVMEYKAEIDWAMGLLPHIVAVIYFSKDPIKKIRDSLKQLRKTVLDYYVKIHSESKYVISKAMVWRHSHTFLKIVKTRLFGQIIKRASGLVIMKDMQGTERVFSDRFVAEMNIDRSRAVFYPHAVMIDDKKIGWPTMTLRSKQDICPLKFGAAVVLDQDVEGLSKLYWINFNTGMSESRCSFVKRRDLSFTKRYLAILTLDDLSEYSIFLYSMKGVKHSSIDLAAQIRLSEITKHLPKDITPRKSIYALTQTPSDLSSRVRILNLSGLVVVQILKLSHDQNLCQHLFLFDMLSHDVPTPRSVSLFKYPGNHFDNLLTTVGQCSLYRTPGKPYKAMILLPSSVFPTFSLVCVYRGTFHQLLTYRSASTLLACSDRKGGIRDGFICSDYPTGDSILFSSILSTLSSSHIVHVHIHYTY